MRLSEVSAGAGPGRKQPRRAGFKALAALAAGSLLLASAGVAYADDIYNTLPMTVDSVSKIMPLNAGGADGTTTLALATKDGDGKSGCNLQGQTTLKLEIVSDQPTVATVSPSETTFTSCGFTQPLTIKPLTGGSTNITARIVGNTTGYSFNTGPAAFIVNVIAAAPANTPPSLVITGPTLGGSSAKGSVPAAVCNVTDKEDNPPSFLATLSAITGPDSADGIGTQEATCYYKDSGGIEVSSSVTYNIIDATAPLISYTLTPANPDGLAGWYRNAVQLTWTVTEADSPFSVRKEGCVDRLIEADQAATSYSCSATSSGGIATWETAPIKKDGTAPTVEYTSATGTLGKNGWYTSAVDALFTGTDTMSGLATDTQTVTSIGQGSVKVYSPAFTDNAGNTTDARADSETFQIDWTAPDVALSGAVPASPNDYGWYNTDVVATFSGFDETSGLQSPASQEETSKGEGAAVKVDSPAFEDVAGNLSAVGAVSATYKIDKTAPKVTSAVLSGTTGANGWYISDVVVDFTGSDQLSGLLSAPATQSVSSSGEGLVDVRSPIFEDYAGNATEEGAVTESFKIDKTAPKAEFSSAVTSGYYGSTATKPTCIASDGGSGLDGSCTVYGYSTSVGKHKLTATATDLAGNKTTITQEYEVLAWAINGFYQPIDMDGVFNTVKGGSTVPAKFEVFAGDREITDASLMAFTAFKITCSAGVVTDEIETLATAGSTILRYDAIGGQFVYNWKTPTGAGTCYKLVMTAKDGSSISANFKLK